MKNILGFVITSALAVGLSACGGEEPDVKAQLELLGDPPQHETRSDAVTRAEYCQTLAFIIEHNWDDADSEEQAAMSAAFGTHCRPMR